MSDQSTNDSDEDPDRDQHAGILEAPHSQDELDVLALVQVDLGLPHPLQHLLLCGEGRLEGEAEEILLMGQLVLDLVSLLLDLGHALLEIGAFPLAVESRLAAHDSVVDLEGLAQGHESVEDDIGDPIVDFEGVGLEVVPPLLLQALPDVLVQVSLQVGLDAVVVGVEFWVHWSLDGLNHSFLEEFVPGPLAEEGLPEILVLDVEIDSWKFEFVLEVEVDVVPGDQAADFDDGADVLGLLYRLLLLLVLDEAAEDLILLGRHVVALALVGVPYFAVLGGLVPPQDEDALAVGECLADDQQGLVIPPALDLVDEVEVVAEQDAVVFSDLHVQQLVALQVELLSPFEEFAVELHGNQGDESRASFDHAAVALVGEFGRTDGVGEVPTDEDALALQVVQPELDVPLRVEGLQPIVGPLQDEGVLAHVGDVLSVRVVGDQTVDDGLSEEVQVDVGVDVGILGLALLLGLVLEVEKPRSPDAVAEADQWPVQLEEPADGGDSDQEGERDIDPSQVELGLLDPRLGDGLGRLALLNQVEDEHLEGILAAHEDLLEVGLLMLHAVVEEERLVPFGEGSLEAPGPLQVALVPQLDEAVDSVEVDVVVVGDFLVGPSLVLEGVEEGVAVHVDVGLLAEEALPVAVEAVEEALVVVVLHHHLLLLELVLVVLELLDPLEGGLADGHVLGRPHVQVDLELVDLGLGLDAHLGLRTQLPLLGEEVLEEDGDGGLHLLEDVLADDLLGYLVARVAARPAARHPAQVVDLAEDVLDLLQHDLRLLLEVPLDGTEPGLLGLAVVLHPVVLAKQQEHYSSMISCRSSRFLIYSSFNGICTFSNQGRWFFIFSSRCLADWTSTKGRSASPARLISAQTLSFSCLCWMRGSRASKSSSQVVPQSDSVSMEQAVSSSAVLVAMSGILLLSPFHSIRCRRTPAGAAEFTLSSFFTSSFACFLTSAPLEAKGVEEYRFSEEVRDLALRPGTERQMVSMTVLTNPLLTTSTLSVAGAVQTRMLNFCWKLTRKEGHCSSAFSLWPTSQLLAYTFRKYFSRLISRLRSSSRATSDAPLPTTFSLISKEVTPMSQEGLPSMLYSLICSFQGTVSMPARFLMSLRSSLPLTISLISCQRQAFSSLYFRFTRSSFFSTSSRCSPSSRRCSRNRSSLTISGREGFMDALAQSLSSGLISSNFRSSSECRGCALRCRPAMKSSSWKGVCFFWLLRSERMAFFWKVCRQELFSKEMLASLESSLEKRSFSRMKSPFSSKYSSRRSPTNRIFCRIMFSLLRSDPVPYSKSPSKDAVWLFSGRSISSMNFLPSSTLRSTSGDAYT